MNAAEKAAWIVLFAPVLAYFAGIVVGICIGRSGEQDKRTRRDLAAIKRMRAMIRELDERTEQFAPLTVANAESFSLGDVAGASSTALTPLPPPPPARRCPIGPEQCECEQCLASGVPPRP